MPRPESGLIVVAHRIPASVTPLAGWLADVADRVVLITSEAAAPGYAGRFGEVIPVADYTGSDEVADHLDRLCRDGRVASIVHGTEDDILRIARVRDRHGIAGLSYDDALVFRDKHRMKVAAEAGVRTPRFLAPGTPAEAVAFAASAGWPVVVKPRLSFGSRGVEVVADEAGLLRLIAERGLDDMLVESYVPGLVYHVDGLMSDGRVLVAVPSRYVNDCLSFTDGSSLGSVQLDADDPLAAALTDFTERAVAVMPATGPTPFHLEVFRHEQSGELYFCEIAARLGGGHIYETLTLAIGRDPVELWFRHQAGLDAGGTTFTRDPERYGFLLVPPRAGTLEEIKDIPMPPAVLRHSTPDDLPQTYQAATASTDTVASFVVTGAGAAEVEASVRACMRWTEDALRWSA
ncbi:hypothetical protein FB565_002402 [Actinoplanes lutulentus]|uniref:Carbamoyl-phosphate synthase L subunit-like protein n=1 Tax=Actinoplanes lutulentus TaxID=1287878 RepID=A0A327ZE74_9ACTN|nr:ATP-grasp domain-containing protein [Actinoplanes lutulentus]MBB2942689.1 hypothetical protein [Actinoplanes lutulentus]RAK38270.1 carbamoyl-phosphate synthase L subunit-like protein [Actinoplanes lutulentus]